MSFGIKFGSFFTGVVEAHDREGTHGDHTDDEDICKLAEEAACGVRRTAPLHAQTIQTDHAVKFSNDEEQEDNPQPGVINLETAAVRSDAARIHQHGEHVREDQSGEDNTGDELNPPHCCVSVTEQFVVAAHDAEGFVVVRELAESKNRVNNNQDEDHADEYGVHPEVIDTVNEVAAGQRNQRPKSVFAKKNGACEAHMAEKEETEDQAGNGLENVAPGISLGFLFCFHQVFAINDGLGRRCHLVEVGDVFEIISHDKP